MRTTLDLNDDLVAEAKALGARDKVTLTRLIEEGLVLRLRESKRQASPGKRPPLPVHHGNGGLTAAVDNPRSNRSLFDAADDLLRP